MAKTQAVRRVAVTMNGISVAYLMGFTNAVMVAVNAFGVNLNDVQRVAVSGLVNASLVLAIHLAHRIGEVAAAGGSGEVSRAQTAEIMAEATTPPSGTA